MGFSGSARRRARRPEARGHRPGWIAVLASVFLFATCTDEGTGPGEVRIGEVRLQPASFTAASLGEQVDFTAQLRDESGAPLSSVPLVWTSSNPSVLVSEGNGRFRAVANGNANVSVSVAGREISQTAPVIIRQVASRLQISADTVSFFALGQTIPVAATAYDALGSALVTQPILSWSSASPQVASVDQNGAVTARADGEAGVVASAGSVTQSVWTRVSATIQITGCVSSAETIGAQSCNNVSLSVRAHN